MTNTLQSDKISPSAENIRRMRQKKEHQIMLNATEDVKEFVNAASKCDFDIDISYNRIIIDAKSLLGILSMDLTRKLTVRCYGENTHFNEVIAKFAVA